MAACARPDCDRSGKHQDGTGAAWQSGAQAIELNLHRRPISPRARPYRHPSNEERARSIPWDSPRAMRLGGCFGLCMIQGWTNGSRRRTACCRWPLLATQPARGQRGRGPSRVAATSHRRSLQQRGPEEGNVGIERWSRRSERALKDPEDVAPCMSRPDNLLSRFVKVNAGFVCIVRASRSWHGFGAASWWKWARWAIWYPPQAMAIGRMPSESSTNCRFEGVRHHEN